MFSCNGLKSSCKTQMADGTATFPLPRGRGSVAAAPDTWALHELALSLQEGRLWQLEDKPSLQEGRLWQLEDKPFTVNSLPSYLPIFLTSKPA